MKNYPDSKVLSHSLIIDLFCDMMLSERGASPLTVENYKTDLKQFFDTAQEGLYLTLTAHHITDYLASLDVSASTKNRKLSAFRQFFSFLVQDHYRSDHPLEDVRHYKTSRALPKFWTPDEIDLLLKTAQADASVKGIRLWAMLELMYATGLRVTELVSLPLSVFMMDRSTNQLLPYIMVTGKRQKERFLPFHEKAQ